MFIKRFYIKLLDLYFPRARFAKPTGDGLLFIFGYTEKTLRSVVEEILGSCLKCLEDFPTLFRDDDMINFETPGKIGFGITRGPACCLYSGRKTIDYSGHLLNLASRLMDLARPSGIVVDGQFLLSVIPEELRKKFIQDKVYIRSISEESPREIFYLKDVVEIPVSAKYPLKEDKWVREVKLFTLRDLSKVPGTLVIRLPRKPVSPDKIRVEFGHPSLKLPGYSTTYTMKFTYSQDAQGPMVKVDTNVARSKEDLKNVKPSANVFFNVDYVPVPEKHAAVAG